MEVRKSGAGVVYSYFTKGSPAGWTTYHFPLTVVVNKSGYENLTITLLKDGYDRNLSYVRSGFNQFIVMSKVRALTLYENIVNATGTHESAYSPLTGWKVWANYTGYGYVSDSFNATIENPFLYNTIVNYSVLPAWNCRNSLIGTELVSGYNVFRGWFDMGGIIQNSTYRAYTYFNTSAIPDNYTVVSANISFYIDSCDKINGTDYNMSIWSDTGTHPIRPLNISEFYYGYYPNYCGIFNTTSYTVPKRYNVKLNVNGINEINTNGLSKYVFRLGSDVYNNSWWNINEYEGIVFSTPVLTVNYTGIPGLNLSENIVNAVGTHDYAWRPLLGVNGEWWV
jgi:hypothetical protein